jgi:glycosyltransferase involved in cell wall biosynthesis
MRGAERTFAAMADVWPDAPIHTLLYDEQGTAGRFSSHRVETSYLQRAGVRQDGFRRLLPLYPGAVARLHTREHDVVVSSSSAFAHGAPIRAGAVHVCYCHTPFRYIWYERRRALRELPWPLRPALMALIPPLRHWDRAAAQRVTQFVANSRITQERIARFWGRASEIVHPPVELARFSSAPAEVEDYVLVVCEVVRHKRVEDALEAAKRARRRIKVVGAGPDLERLRTLHQGDSVEFLGRATDAELEILYRRAAALIVPNAEEFGIAAVEAQASGRPVVAAAQGGALETVEDGTSGVLFGLGDVGALAEILGQTDFGRFDSAAIRASAERFSVEAFQSRMASIVARAAGRAGQPRRAAS